MVVTEARPGISDPPPAAPLRLPAIREADAWRWRPASDLEVRAASGWVELAWEAQPAQILRLRRADSEFGLLLPVEQAASR